MTTAAQHRNAHAAAPVKDDNSSVEFDEDDRAIQIAAAQLRLVTDRRLGKVTPERVKTLAREEPRHAS
jgi:hypothetical protein